METSDVIIYSGHSGLGGNLDIPSLEEKAGAPRKTSITTSTESRNTGSKHRITVGAYCSDDCAYIPAKTGYFGAWCTPIIAS